MEHSLTEALPMTKTFWREIVALLPQRYEILAGRVGRFFIDALAEELEGVEGRQ